MRRKIRQVTMVLPVSRRHHAQYEVVAEGSHLAKVPLEFVPNDNLSATGVVSFPRNDIDHIEATPLPTTVVLTFDSTAGAKGMFIPSSIQLDGRMYDVKDVKVVPV
jgi:hypothetical protein